MSKKVKKAEVTICPVCLLVLDEGVKNCPACHLKKSEFKEFEFKEQADEYIDKEIYKRYNV